MVALGWTDGQIGKALGYNAFTISHTVARVCRFLGIDSGPRGSSSRRAQLAAWAGRNGYAAGTVNPS